MIKTVQEYKEYGVQFTDEELADLGMHKNQKFSIEVGEDNTIKLIPFVKIDVNIDEFPRDILEKLVRESAEKDVPVNAIICDILEDYLSYEE